MNKLLIEKVKESILFGAGMPNKHQKGSQQYSYLLTKNIMDSLNTSFEDGVEIGHVQNLDKELRYFLINRYFTSKDQIDESLVDLVYNDVFKRSNWLKRQNIKMFMSSIGTNNKPLLVQMIDTLPMILKRVCKFNNMVDDKVYYVGQKTLHFAQHNVNYTKFDDAIKLTFTRKINPRLKISDIINTKPLIQSVGRLLTYCKFYDVKIFGDVIMIHPRTLKIESQEHCMAGNTLNLSYPEVPLMDEHMVSSSTILAKSPLDFLNPLDEKIDELKKKLDTCDQGIENANKAVEKLIAHKTDLSAQLDILNKAKDILN